MLRRRLRHGVVELARMWITLDRGALLAFPSRTFQVVKTPERFRISGVVMFQRQRSLLFKLAARPPQVGAELGTRPGQPRRLSLRGRRDRQIQRLRRALASNRETFRGGEG